jgi:purine-nucleoside phosphorylase
VKEKALPSREQLILKGDDNLVYEARKACATLRNLLPCPPEIVIIFGTGLGTEMSALFQDGISVDYEAIPYIPRSTVSGHHGRLHCGCIGDRTVALLEGRWHFYEGYSAVRLGFPVRVMALLGARFLIVCNSAGGLNPDLSPGNLMLIRDHLSFIPDNPLRGPNIDSWGPRFVDMSAAYDPELLVFAEEKAVAAGLGSLAQGIYVAVPGPSLETPAETRFLRNCGADAVGMSTVPEVIVARHAGMRVLGISLVANVNDPEKMQPILLEEVLRQAETGSKKLERLLLAMLKDWPEE